LQLQEIHADVSVKTSDNAFLTLPVKVQYRASDDPVGAVKAHYELESPERQISSYVLNNVRQTASAMEMTDLYANRDAVESQVQTALSEQFAHFGYIIENVLVDEPQPSQEVRDAFNRVIASKRLMEAARNEAEAERIKLVGAAQAEAESKKLQGEGMAQMREAVARGLQEAMQTMGRAGLSPDMAVRFLTDTNRIDAITSAASHGNTIILDVGADRSTAAGAAVLEALQK
jgi:regulator of protease activity HflC (stomatin/prohibitin superfamily)